MSTKTGISWTSGTWNPVLGCSKVSPGCAKCYAVREVHRMAGNPNATIRAANEGLTAYHRNGQLDWTGVVRIVPERLTLPLTWRTPKRVFVNSLSDLFHEGLPDDEIAMIFGVMAVAGSHTFQVLTKRPQRTAQLLGDTSFRQMVAEEAANRYYGATPRVVAGSSLTLPDDPASLPGASPAEVLAHLTAYLPWPLPNVWLGTSVEDQVAADTRIPHLLATPAAVRFLSCEPLLGPLNLHPYLPHAFNREPHCPWCEECIPDLSRSDWWKGKTAERHGPFVGWVIIGGESGPGARGLHADWVNDLIGQCVEADVAVFVKQTGSVWAREHGYQDRKGGTPAEWPVGWQVRAFPEVSV